jgi:penicillin G amidase
MYDDQFNGRGRVASNVNLAVRWMAHEPSNELKAFTGLSRSKDYDDYAEAIKHFICPGQNFAFASKSGDIALWQQGKFPNKWKMQGDFIMPGTDTTFSWKSFIPQAENPHVMNPPRGFVSSANQVPADSTYPYYLGGDYDVYRGLQINRMLEIMNGVTPDDMQRLQNDNYNAFAEAAVPYMIQHIKEDVLTAEEKKFLDTLRSWNYRNDNDQPGPTIFINWFDVFEDMIWEDDLAKQPGPSRMPDSPTLIELLKRDSAFEFTDDVNTPQIETIEDIVTKSFQKTCVTLATAEKDGKLAWSKFKDSGIRHLLRIEPLSRFHLNTGGGRNVINATQQYRGPSWKMIVQLTDSTEAYGIYPGGQNGNAGSKHYDEFVTDWSEGRYYTLWHMRKDQAGDKRVKSVLKFLPAFK